MSENFVYPHEVKVEGVPFGEMASPSFVRSYTDYASVSMRTALCAGRGGDVLELQLESQRVLNGERGAGKLSDKLQFGELVSELGYQTPTTICIPVGYNSSQIETEISESSLSDEKELFVKPHGGAHGHLARMENRAQVSMKLHHPDRPFLVQQYQKPEQDWRVILHRTPREMEQFGKGQDVRIAYRKVRPTVTQTSDKWHTVQKLIEMDPDIPDYVKHKLYSTLPPERLQHIPGRSERVELVDTGNIIRGAYGVLPTQDELIQMDRLVSRIRNDIEQRLNVRLATLCLDLGVLKEEQFLSAQNDTELRQAVTIYEQQSPVEYSGYRDSMPIKQVFDRFRNAANLFRLRTSFVQSGRIAQSQNRLKNRY